MKNSNNGVNEPNQETSNFPFVVHNLVVDTIQGQNLKTVIGIFH